MLQLDPLYAHLPAVHALRGGSEFCAINTSSNLCSYWLWICGLLCQTELDRWWFCSSGGLWGRWQHIHLLLKSTEACSMSKLLTGCNASGPHPGNCWCAIVIKSCFCVQSVLGKHIPVQQPSVNQWPLSVSARHPPLPSPLCQTSPEGSARKNKYF